MTEKIRTSLIWIYRDHILGFWAQDLKSNCPKKRYFFLPGGKPNLGESLMHAVLRETLEETGLSPTLIVDYQGMPKQCLKTYIMEWGNIIYYCKTTYFFSKSIPNEVLEKIIDADYHQGSIWLPISQMNEAMKETPIFLNHLKDFLDDKIIP